MVCLVRLIRIAGFLTLLLGAGLHLTVRDAWHPLAAVFYGLSLPILALGWAGLTVIQPRKTLVSRFCFLLAVALTCWWLAASYKRNPAAPLGAPPLKTLFWNLAHSTLPNADLTEIIEQEKPDIATFVEVGRRWGDPSALLTHVPAGYQVLKLNHAMAIVVRGTATITREMILPEDTKLVELKATVDGVPWKVVIADVVSSPVVSRANSLATALSWATGTDRTLVMGDFNTPLDSAYFDPWKLSLKDAFATSGRGLSETWPRWVPVLTIDHIWCSPDAAPLSARHLWRKFSDHGALWVEITPPSAPVLPAMPSGR